MHLEPLDWTIIIGFIALIVGVGIWASRKSQKGLEGFFLGGRNLPWWLAGISMVATTFAADTPLAVTEIVAANGIAGNWLWWNFLAGGMLTTFLFARLWQRSGVLTEVELIELRYSGPIARFLRGFKAVYLGVFMNILVIAWVNLALQTVLEVFFEIPAFDAWLYTGGMMLIAASYSALSGFKGVVVTDAIQFVVAMFGCIILCYWVLDLPQIGGLDGLRLKLEAKDPALLNFLPQIGSETTVGTTLGLGIGGFLAYAGLQWWACWYPGAEPGGGGYVAQRMLSAKSEKDAVYATLFFQIAHYCIRPWPWIIVGLATILLYPGLEEARYGYVYAMRDVLPVGWKGLLIAAFLAAYMSTISTQLNWGAGYLVNDLYKRFLATDKTPQHYVRISRIATILLMFLGLWIGSYIDSIKGVWEFLMQCGAGLGLVLILRWYWWRVNAWSELAATIAPVICTILFKVLGWEFPTSFILTILITTVVWVIVTLLTPPTDKATLLKFYQKVQPLGAWGNLTQNAATPAFSDSNILDDHSIENTTILNEPTGQLRWLFLCWGSGLVFTYSLLFGFGKLLLASTNIALLLFGVAFISFFILRWAMQKANFI